MTYLNVSLRERLVEKTKPIEDAIHRNKLKIFGQPATKPQAKGKQQMKSLKNDVDVFSRLYIGCQNRDGNLDDFFQHALSDFGGIRLGVKSDLLTCLEDFSQPRSEVPPASCIVLWSSHHPVAEACYSKNLQRVCPAILCALHTLKTSSSDATGPGVGPLHYRLVEGYSKSQEGKRGEKTSGEWCNYTRELGQIPQSRREQDRAVQLPFWHPLRLIPACRQGARHH